MDEARPPNPELPPEGQRATYVITFDYSVGATEGMLDALRNGGFYARSNPCYPRTTIICRTSDAVKFVRVLRVISENLEANGSAMVVRLGHSAAWIWPDKPWRDTKKKEWKSLPA